MRSVKFEQTIQYTLFLHSNKNTSFELSQIHVLFSRISTSPLIWFNYTIFQVSQSSKVIIFSYIPKRQPNCRSSDQIHWQKTNTLHPFIEIHMKYLRRMDRRLWFGSSTGAPLRIYNLHAAPWAAVCHSYDPFSAAVLIYVANRPAKVILAENGHSRQEGRGVQGTDDEVDALSKTN